METIPQMDEARALLRNAERVLIITGAGISAESGVPTFRGAGERWRNKHFTDLASAEAFARDPREIWDWYLYRRQVVAQCVPNAAHRALAEWAASRPNITLVTQNVDGLHEASGHPNVLRLHGSLWKNRCTACGKEREEKSLSYEHLPLSPCCDALERPDIVWFGENLPIDPFIAARIRIWSAHAVLVVGTSGFVSSALYLADDARGFGVPIVNVNVEASLIDADIDIRGTAVGILPGLLS